jgi:hypothetical protein
MLFSTRLITAAAVVAAAVFAGSASARPTAICGEGTYAYAGFDGHTASRGVSATIAQTGPLQVRSGHVAGWIGVAEPNAAESWLQIGLSALPNDTTSAIYYEVAFPGHAAAYHVLATGVTTGAQHRFAVLEMPSRPNWWRVWLDGKPASAPLYLRGSHGRWTAQVLGESWAGTATGPCNAYSYGFSGVSLLEPRDRAAMLAGPNYAVLRRSKSSFVATSVGSRASA